MEKEFVTYKLALRMKALGFNEPCLGYYAGDILCTGQPQEIHLDEDGNYKKSKTESFPITVAPTYSQVFRWFREKYDLHHVIHQFTFKKGTDEEYLAEVAKADDTFSECRTYEDAEVACLEKLIEIIEEKQK
jgi:hypothetical protein